MLNVLAHFEVATGDFTKMFMHLHMSATYKTLCKCNYAHMSDNNFVVEDIRTPWSLSA